MGDIESPAALRKQRDQRELQIAEERERLIAGFKQKVADEEAPAVDEGEEEPAEPAVDRAEVEALSAEMAALEAEWEKCNSDITLLTAFTESQDQVAEAEKCSQTAHAPVLAEIQAVHERNFQLRKEEIEMQEGINREYRERFDDLRGQLAELHANRNAEEAAISRDFGQKKTQACARAQAKVHIAEKALKEAQEELDSEVERLAKEEADDLVRFNSLFDSLAAKLEQRTDPRLATVASRITAKTKERNLARLQFETAGVRDQERIEIDRLEGLLADTTDEFARANRCLELAQEALTGDEEPRPMSSGSSRSKLPSLRATGMARI
jgi:hypothetical protein